MVIEGNRATEMLISKHALYGMEEHGLAVWDKGFLVPEPEFAKELAETFARRTGGRLVRFWFDNGAGGLFCEVEAGLRPEAGTTDHSTANGRWLSLQHGKVMSVRLEYNATAEEWYKAHVAYADGFTFTFTGFAWGYSGEGSRGLGAWANENDVPLNFAQIMTLDNAVDGTTWEWAR